MKNTTKITAIVGIVVVLILLYFTFRSKGPKYDWSTNYYKGSKQPYGTELFYRLLEKTNTVDQVSTILSPDLDTTLRATNFFYLHENFELDSEDCQQALRYVEKGNNLIIATDDAPLELLRCFVPVTDTIQGFRFYRDSITTLSFETKLAPYPKPIDLVYRKFNDTIGYAWGYYHKRYFTDTLVNYGFSSYAFFPDSNVCAFTISHGKGNILIHANPILFTNFYFARSEGFAHTNNMLAQFAKGKVLWHEYDYDSYSGANAYSNNPLRFLFSQKSLKFGWYIFLLALVLYILFRSKREQRVIPILPRLKNTAVEFIKTSALLYYKSNGHHHIAKEMHLVFLADVRHKLNLATDLPEQDLIKNIAIKSGIETQIITKLFSHFKYVMTPNVATNDDLIDLHHQLENYHKLSNNYQWKTQTK